MNNTTGKVIKDHNALRCHNTNILGKKHVSTYSRKTKQRTHFSEANQGTEASTKCAWFSKIMILSNTCNFKWKKHVYKKGTCFCNGLESGVMVWSLSTVTESCILYAHLSCKSILGMIIQHVCWWSIYIQYNSNVHFILVAKHSTTSKRLHFLRTTLKVTPTQSAYGEQFMWKELILLPYVPDHFAISARGDVMLVTWFLFWLFDQWVYARHCPPCHNESKAEI